MALTRFFFLFFLFLFLATRVKCYARTHSHARSRHYSTISTSTMRTFPHFLSPFFFFMFGAINPLLFIVSRASHPHGRQPWENSVTRKPRSRSS
jgi:hypothetical protein